jgi:hypothetical protein
MLTTINQEGSVNQNHKEVPLSSSEWLHSIKKPKKMTNAGEDEEKGNRSLLPMRVQIIQPL